MGAPYHQFCPVAKAMELLDERWTLLVVRELLLGSRRFNDLRRGVPRMSPTLLSKRLRELIARRGRRAPTEGGERVRYLLHRPVGSCARSIEALGAWGIRWIGRARRPGPRPEAPAVGHAPACRRDALPAGRTVIHFLFPDVPAAPHWWLVLTRTTPTSATPTRASLRAVRVTAAGRWWRSGWATPAGRRRSERATCSSTDRPNYCRALPRWFTLSAFAAVPRPTRRSASRPYRMTARPPAPIRHDLLEYIDQYAERGW